MPQMFLSIVDPASTLDSLIALATYRRIKVSRKQYVSGIAILKKFLKCRTPPRIEIVDQEMSAMLSVEDEMLPN
jgi:hypothetical protein